MFLTTTPTWNTNCLPHGSVSWRCRYHTHYLPHGSVSWRCRHYTYTYYLQHLTDVSDTHTTYHTDLFLKDVGNEAPDFGCEQEARFEAHLQRLPHECSFGHPGTEKAKGRKRQRRRKSWTAVCVFLDSTKGRESFIQRPSCSAMDTNSERRGVLLLSNFAAAAHIS